jgi:hypothetical protein
LTRHIPRPETWLLLAALLPLTIAAGAPPVLAQEAAAEPPAERTSRLGGRVYLERRDPVVGSTVLVHEQGNSTRLFLTSTDDGGIFRVNGLPDGMYRVRVEREGLGAQVKDDVTLKFPFRAVVELDLDPVGSDAAAASRIMPDGSDLSGPLLVRGRVVTVDDEPVGEVALRFVRIDGAEDPRVVRSLPDGRFELGGVGSSVWRLEVNGVGYLAQRMALALHDETSLRVIVVPQPANYDPTPTELMPSEQLIPPPGFLDDETEEGAAEAEQGTTDNEAGSEG